MTTPDNNITTAQNAARVTANLTANLTGSGGLQTAGRGALRLATESHLDAQPKNGATSSRPAAWRPPLPVTQALIATLTQNHAISSI